MVDARTSIMGLFEQARVAGRPVLCVEVNPPRGVDLSPVFERISAESLQGCDFLNVTDSALARMRLSPLPFAAMLKERFKVEPLVNISCRDRNLIALQADLLAGWVSGIRSVVALTGDAVTIGDAPETKGVFEVNSVGLLGVIKKLNSGTDWVGNQLKGVPAFTAGVVVNPNARNSAAEIKRLIKKVEAGACYALSQPVFDIGAATSFFGQAKVAGIPILMGLMAVRSKAAVAGLDNIPGIKVPEEIRQRALAAGESEDLSGFFISHALQLARAVRECVAGFHVISGTTPKLGMTLLRELVREFK